MPITIETILIARDRGGEMEELQSAWLLPGRGIRGDRRVDERRARKPKSQITIVDWWVLAELHRRTTRAEPTNEDVLAMAKRVRRNVVVRAEDDSKIDMLSMVDEQLDLGHVDIVAIELCDPCPRMGVLQPHMWELGGGLRCEIPCQYDGSAKFGDPDYIDDSGAPYNISRGDTFAIAEFEDT